MAEHLTRNEKVVGSIPTSSSKTPCILSGCRGFVLRFYHDYMDLVFIQRLIMNDAVRKAGR